MLNAFDKVRSLETHHCVTGSMKHVYAFYDHAISEDMLLGLGEGVGYIYWHQKGQIPFFGGRAQPEPSLEEIAGQRTGVKITAHTTSSARKAESALIALLEQEIPVMLQVDMGFLPYFDFDGEEYHFGGHLVVVCGYEADSRQVLIADRDLALHPVPLEALAQARGSTYKPFPPKNRWYTCNFTEKRQPTHEEIYTAIANQVDRMLNPPISNIGVKGIYKTAKLVPQWRETLSDRDLKFALFNAYVFISPVGGSGGGTFRYMFSRFLKEAADRTGNSALADSAQEFRHIGDQWEALGEWFRQMSEHPAPGDHLHKATVAFNEIAKLEESAWATLAAITQDVSMQMEPIG